jgi:hypothetical protein
MYFKLNKTENTMSIKPQLFFDSAAFIDKITLYSKYEHSFLKQMQRFYNSTEALKLSDREFIVLDELVKIGERRTWRTPTTYN